MKIDKKVKTQQKAIWRWHEVEDVFTRAYNHFVRRTGAASEQDFLRYLVCHGSQSELRRKIRA